MKLELVGYDAKNKTLKLPKILSYQMHIGKRGSDVWFEFRFFENISNKLVKVDIYRENRKNLNRSRRVFFPKNQEFYLSNLAKSSSAN